MILVTGAGGKTGQAILRALQFCGAESVAFAHSPQGAEAAVLSGAAKSVCGDFLDPAALTTAFEGVRVVYHICPNMHPAEVEIAEAVLAAARAAGVQRIVFHSVLHPQVEAMAHHWKKMRVEEMLFTCGIPFTILQPCAYMQNMLGYWKTIQSRGEYAVPYGLDTRLSMVDLRDVAKAAAQVLLDEKHAGAIYELVGPQALTVTETVEIITRVTGWKISAKALDRMEWSKQAKSTGMPEYTLETLQNMFIYYEKYGFTGNSAVLEYLIGQRPCDFTQYIQELTTQPGF